MKSSIKKNQVIYVLQTTEIAGGIRVVFEHVNRLNLFGVPSEIYALQGSPNWIKSNTVKAFRTYEELSVELSKQRCIKVATFWKTASTVINSSKQYEAFYLVQDIEKMYYSDKKTRGEVLETYNFPFRFLATAKWVEDQLITMGKSPSFIGIGIDHEVYKRLPNIVRRRNLILINAPRRGVLWNIKGMGILYKVLKKILLLNPEVEVISFSPESYGFDFPDNRYRHYSNISDQQIVELYNTAGCFLVCSRHEGFCLPALEAMACGCPVVTTNADSNTEFCIDEHSCLMAERNIDDITNTVLRLLTDNSLIRRVRDGGFEISRKYRWDKVISALVGNFDL